MATQIDYANLSKKELDTLRGEHWDKIEALHKNFKRPFHRGQKMPFVLFAKITRERTKKYPDDKKNNEYIKRPRPELFTLNCGGSHGHPERLQYYANKGYVILDWWFPEQDDLPPRTARTESGWVAKMRDPSFRGFKDLQEKCEQLKGIHSGIAERDTEIRGLKAKLAKALSENEEGTNGRNQSNQGSPESNYESGTEEVQGKLEPKKRNQSGRPSGKEPN